MAGKSRGRGEVVTDDQFVAFNYDKEVVVPILEADRVSYRAADSKIIRINVDTGIANFRERATDIAKKNPDCNVREALETPALALALDYAVGRVAVPASGQEIAQKLRQLRPMREYFLKQLEVFAWLKLVPAERVQAIRAGSGSLDAADDGVKAVGLFLEFAGAIAGRHPFPQSMLDEAAAIGNWLLAQITPGGAQSAPSKLSPEQIVRDQLFTELGNRYERAREAGVSVFTLRRLDEFMPPLLSRVHASQAATASTGNPAGGETGGNAGGK